MTEDSHRTSKPGILPSEELGRETEGAGRERTMNELCERYFARVAGLARACLGRYLPEVSGQDIAVSVLRSFAQETDGNLLADLCRDDRSLWGILARKTMDKAANARRRERAQKRGGGRTSRFSDLDCASLTDFVAKEPSHEDVVDVLDLLAAFEQRLCPELRIALQLRVEEKLSNTEIAERLGGSRRRVDRMFETIRGEWARWLESNEVAPASGSVP